MRRLAGLGVLLGGLVLLAAAPSKAGPTAYYGLTAKEWGQIIAKANLAGVLAAAADLERGGSKALPVVIELLGHRDNRVCRWAAVIAGGIGIAREDVLSGLARQAGRFLEPDLRRAYLRLAPRDQVIDDLLGRLAGTNPEARSHAGRVLIALDAKLDRVVAVHLEALCAGETSAADILGRCGAEARIAVPHLRKMLGDKTLRRRLAAAAALGRLGVHLDRALPIVAEALRNPVPFTRTDGWQALIGIGEKGRKASASQLAYLESGDSFGRLAASLVLLVTGFESDRARATLLEVWRVDPVDISVHFEVLMCIDSEGSPALLRSLLTTLETGSEEDRRLVARILPWLARPDEALPVLLPLAMSRDAEVGEWVNMLPWHARGDAVIPVLEKALESEDTRMRMQAARQLYGASSYRWRDELPSPDLAPRLLEHLLAGLREEKLSVIAGEALVEAGPRAALPRLRTLLDDPDASVRRRAVRVLLEFREMAAPLTGDLILLLADPDAPVRLSAAAGLGFIGPPARKAIPELERMLGTESSASKATIRRALSRIRDGK